jgi:hypothetical protein
MGFLKNLVFGPSKKSPEKSPGYIPPKPVPEFPPAPTWQKVLGIHPEARYRSRLAKKQRKYNHQARLDLVQQDKHNAKLFRKQMAIPKKRRALLRRYGITPYEESQNPERAERRVRMERRKEKNARKRALLKRNREYSKRARRGLGFYKGDRK